MMRSTLLYLSRNQRLRQWMETSPVAKKLSERFVAGRTLEPAISLCLKLRAEGIRATLDYLGEHVKSPEEAEACRDVYLGMLRAMAEAGVEPNVSLKLTQFGIDFSKAACEENVATVVREAAEVGGFVRIDMEGSRYTERTVEIASKLHREHGACGTVLQAYLFRSAADVARANTEGMRIRLCKGAYLEPPELAYSLKSEVDRNYMELAACLLTGGHYPAIATHDERIIETVERFAANKRMARDAFEFQMLYGIRRDLQKRLVEDGYRLRLYVPFGDGWYPYFMRRLAERPANVVFLVRNLVRL